MQIADLSSHLAERTSLLEHVLPVFLCVFSCYMLSGFCWVFIVLFFFSFFFCRTWRKKSTASPDLPCRVYFNKTSVHSNVKLFTLVVFTFRCVYLTYQISEIPHYLFSSMLFIIEFLFMWPVNKRVIVNNHVFITKKWTWINVIEA